ncbi:hypothetical protein ACFFHM_20050 [Halalkalibacter kiskunsagensis]|uniref:Uncharacterized protein n=1 Tax=Halalkalibacter kiskunsagensis TaxID=1548599 RepID=A0ABV6KHG8_9BACI
MQKLDLLEVNLTPPFHVFLIELKEGKARGSLLIKRFEEVVNKNQSLVGFLEVNKLFILLSGLSCDRQIGRPMLSLKIDYHAICYTIGSP